MELCVCQLAQPMMDMDQQMYGQPAGFRQPAMPMGGPEGMMPGTFTQGPSMNTPRYMAEESPVMEVHIHGYSLR